MHSGWPDGVSAGGSDPRRSRHSQSAHAASMVAALHSGSVCAHGVGHSYLLRPDGVDLTVTSWRGTGPPADAMAREVKAALAELQRLVEATPGKPRSRL